LCGCLEEKGEDELVICDRYLGTRLGPRKRGRLEAHEVSQQKSA